MSEEEQRIADIMQQRVSGLSDDETLRELIAAGDTEHQARKRMRMQDMLLTKDTLEEENPKPQNPNPNE